MDQKSYTLQLFVALLLTFTLHPGHAADSTLGDFGARVFQFQEKLAMKGNHLAQYKLGTMYELGVAVESNLDEALGWYQKSADQGYEPAKNRIIYLEIKHRGFDKNKHGQWLADIQKAAQALDSNAILLLGQMHHHGIAVERDLDQALALLSRASSLGHTEIDGEIAQVENKIRLRKQAEEEARRAEQQQQHQSSNEIARARELAKQREEQKRREEEAAIAEKRRRYEEAMRKLMEERRIIEEQQLWAEGKQ
ncbi:MAG: hypothetical protein EP315_01815 [Gammaproteobacteria bacterium]|nr:MAG: hypothetical protein EP315_01815 [Gammaproteobacteria bacterium]